MKALRDRLELKGSEETPEITQSESPPFSSAGPPASVMRSRPAGRDAGEGRSPCPDEEKGGFSLCDFPRSPRGRVLQGDAHCEKLIAKFIGALEVFRRAHFETSRNESVDLLAL